MRNLVTEYRQLLKASESLHTLDRVLALLDQATEQPSPAQGVTVRQFQLGDPDALTPYEPSRVPVAVLRDGDAKDAEPPLQQRPPRRVRAQDHSRFLRAQWYLVALPEQLPLRNFSAAQSALILDALLLLFHHAYFVLLPRLEAAQRALSTELIDSFFRFAAHLPDLAERFRVEGLAYEAKGEPEEALIRFANALRATHTDEHVFMTRLQTFWMSLLDRGDFRGALNLLLETVRMVPLSRLSELQELISDTFTEYGAACAAGRAT